MPKNIPHRPCVPPRDSKRFLAFPDPLALAFSFFIVLSLGLVPRRGDACAKYRVLAHPQIVAISDGLRLKNPRRSRMCVCVCTYTRVNAFDVSYVAFDRMQLNCRYKSMKSWVS